MRGGAIPLVCWMLLLSLTGTINAIWTGDAIQIGTFAAAVLTIGTLAALLILRSPEARRPGEPSPRTGPEAVPSASVAVVVIAIGFGTLLFGFVFGHFPIYLGAGVMAAGLGRLGLELRSQRKALASAPRRQRVGGEQ